MLFDVVATFDLSLVGGRTGIRRRLRGSLLGSAPTRRKRMCFAAVPLRCDRSGCVRQIVLVIGPARRAGKASGYPCYHKAKGQDGILQPVLQSDCASIIAFSGSSAGLGAARA